MSMADNTEPGFLRFRAEWLVVYVGIVIMLFGWNLFPYYTQGLVVTIGPSVVWTIIGLLVLFGGIGIVGAVAEFRHRTRKVIAENKMFQLAFDKPRTVEIVYHRVNEGELVGLTKTERAEAELAAKNQPGTDGFGNKVRVGVLLPGGVDAHGFKSLEAGSQGAILYFGDDQLIKLDECMLIPHILIPRDHTTIPVEVLNLLENQSHFKRGSTPIYITGGLSPGIHRWLLSSPRAQSAVLRGIGYDGMEERFATRLIRLISTGKIPILSDLDAAANRALIAEIGKTVKAELGEWLTKQESLKVALGNGSANEDFWRTQYFGAMAELVLAEARIHEKNDALYMSDKALRGRYEERALINRTEYTRVPGYDLSAMRPARATEE